MAPRPRLAVWLLPLLLASTSAPAQVYGYPIDPSQQTGRDSGRSSSDRNGGQNSERTGEDAARTQSSTGTTGSFSRYEPDEIQDRSGNREPADDRDRALTDRERLRDDVRPLVQAAPPASEFERYVSEIVDKPLRRFGSNLLVPGSRDFTAPPTAAVPPDYRLNPGDEILVGLSGSVEATNLRLVIDSEGRVFIPRVGAVNVAGSRYGDLQALISRAVSRQYRNFRVAVTIGELHGITVYVTGFARVPGSYTVSSLSTLVNAVLAAGGPSAGGSFRSIQVRRNGKLVSDFDLYELLLKGDRSADIVLQNGDVLYIAPAGPQVAVVGSVNVEAIYEARANESLQDMLLYAGGVNTVADNTRLLVLDPTKAGGWQELAPAQVEQRTASRGEILRVLPAIGIVQPQARQPALVMINGEVARPGRYYVQPGTPLSSVIAQAGGLTPQAYVYGTVFTRETVKQTQRTSYRRAVSDLELLLTTQPLTSVQTDQLQPARLQAVQSIVDQLERREPDGRMVLNVQPASNGLPGEMIVENNDTIYVPPQPVTVGVFGAVPSPASFQYVRGETIGDYLRRAGGVQKIGDRKQMFVIRANGTLIAQTGGLFRGSVLKAPALPGDLIFVPVNATRGEFWARLRDISSALTPAIFTAAAIAK
ncbi:SLBB domain-containing protein [Sphingomonas sp. GCM10030256]|uniref:SLBB domain-containing protein n=1 Tax=Sphingomonas sp. GCM10030256 TaxID=3273427 RepID=UPI0036118505